MLNNSKTLKKNERKFKNYFMYAKHNQNFLGDKDASNEPFKNWCILTANVVDHVVSHHDMLYNCRESLFETVHVWSGVLCACL